MRKLVVDASKTGNAVVERFSVILLRFRRHGVSVVSRGQHHVTAAVGRRETVAGETVVEGAVSNNRIPS